MAWFGFGKRNKAGEKEPLRDGNAPQAAAMHPEQGREGASVKVLGSGCAKCNQLEAATKAALAQLGRSTEIEHVTDFAQIAAYGVMTTPALVVDGAVVSFGRVLTTEEAVVLLKKAHK